jgi:sugar phosphate isomerase/epimerase
MIQDCPERRRLEHEWNQAIDLANDLEKELHAVVVEGYQGNPELTAKVREAWERADSTWKSFDAHCSDHGC